MVSRDLPKSVNTLRKYRERKYLKLLMFLKLSARAHHTLAQVGDDIGSRRGFCNSVKASVVPRAINTLAKILRREQARLSKGATPCSLLDGANKLGSGQ